MPGSILYLGDTDLQDAAAYLAGLMTRWGWEFDYVASNEPATVQHFEQPRSLFVLSDYPSSQLDDALQQRLLEHVTAGAGLLMCGGWESFHGLGGDWDGSVVAQALPVEISNQDDRVNCDRPVLVCKSAEHSIVADLPWKTRPPVIGGFNRVTAVASATVVLEAQQFDAQCVDGSFTFEATRRDPLLIVDTFQSGRTAVLTTDVAPHWVGPLVDWGDGRVQAQAAGANDVEVGDNYDKFLRQLLGWTARKD